MNAAKPNRPASPAPEAAKAWLAAPVKAAGAVPDGLGTDPVLPLPTEMVVAGIELGEPVPAGMVLLM